MSIASAAKFDPARAGEYAVQSRIALAGYDACHELATCLLVAALGYDSHSHILAAGAGGTAQEIVNAARAAPNWRFTAVDPSPPMLDFARTNITAAGFGGRVDIHLGTIDDLRAVPRFDAATLIGVLHHLPGAEAKAAILASLAARLKPGAPLILACNRGAYEGNPLFLAAWRERWRLAGASDAEADAKIATILRGADPPVSDDVIEALLREAGFRAPQLFFSSLFWGGWIAARQD